MSYLDRLKGTFSEDTGQTALTKLTKPGSLSFVSFPCHTFAQNTLTPEERQELEQFVVLVARHYGCPRDELRLMQEAARKDPVNALTCFRAIAEREGLRTGGRSTEGLAAVVRLRLVLEGEDGHRTEATLEIPRKRYDGMAVLEAFERHHLAGTTRVVEVRPIEEKAPAQAPGRGGSNV